LILPSPHGQGSSSKIFRLTSAVVIAIAEFKMGLFPPDHHVPATVPMPTQPTKTKK
jgi:hypothetical protein